MPKGEELENSREQCSGSKLPGGETQLSELRVVSRGGLPCPYYRCRGRLQEIGQCAWSLSSVVGTESVAQGHLPSSIPIQLALRSLELAAPPAKPLARTRRAKRALAAYRKDAGLNRGAGLGCPKHREL